MKVELKLCYQRMPYTGFENADLELYINRRLILMMSKQFWNQVKQDALTYKILIQELKERMK